MYFALGKDMNFEGPEGRQLWVELCSPNCILPVSVNVTLFGNRVFVDIINLNEVIRVGPNPI